MSVKYILTFAEKIESKEYLKLQCFGEGDGHDKDVYYSLILGDTERPYLKDSEDFISICFPINAISKNLWQK
jgi:hypothetical protein